MLAIAAESTKGEFVREMATSVQQSLIATMSMGKLR
jgi:hypothetical protein